MLPLLLRSESGRIVNVSAKLGTLCFFFQAEDGIRDYKVTGVQTCALPISIKRRKFASAFSPTAHELTALDCSRRRPDCRRGALPSVCAGHYEHPRPLGACEIGRASCRERV